MVMESGGLRRGSLVSLSQPNKLPGILDRLQYTGPARKSVVVDGSVIAEYVPPVQWRLWRCLRCACGCTVREWGGHCQASQSDSTRRSHPSSGDWCCSLHHQKVSQWASRAIKSQPRCIASSQRHPLSSPSILSTGVLIGFMGFVALRSIRGVISPRHRPDSPGLRPSPSPTYGLTSSLLSAHGLHQCPRYFVAPFLIDNRLLPANKPNLPSHHGPTPLALVISKSQQMHQSAFLFKPSYAYLVL